MTLEKSQFVFPKGVHTVLVTPFTGDTFDIDFDNIKSWFNMQANTNVTGLVLFGSTSEAGMLSECEKMDILKQISTYNSKLENPKFITVGISGSNDIREIIQFAEECEKYCDAFMITVPNYVKPTQQGIIKWYKTICNRPKIQNKSIIMYNIPSRTCINMTPETMKIIYDCCPNVIAVKEASGSLEQICNVINLIPNINLFSGDDGLTLDVIKNGGVGVISVASNVVPNLMVNITNLSLDSSYSNNYSEAENLINKSSLNVLLKNLFCQSNPIPIKFALYSLGIFDSYLMRLPLLPLNEEFHSALIESLTYTKQYDR